MKTGEEEHKPTVEFTDEEIAVFDKAFFREAFAMAAAMRGRQIAYLHTVAGEITTTKAAILTYALQGNAEAMRVELVQLAASCARAARLAKVREGTGREFEASKIPHEANGRMDRDENGKRIYKLHG